MGKLIGFVQELRRRRVFRTAGFYIVGAWAALQVFDLAFQSFDIPETTLRYVWIAALAGFPLALVFGWRYDISAAGISRTAPGHASAEDLQLRRSDYLLLTILAGLAVAFVGATVREVSLDARDAGPWFAATADAPSIAVLPLENLSADSTQDFVSAGLHDALIITLSRITRFRVTSRFSAQRAARSDSLADIRRLLRVDSVLSGSVTRDADQVRVNVTLIDAASEETLWAESFTRSFDGLIDMQNEVASAVAREVKVQLTPVEAERLQQQSEIRGATYEAYLRGLFQLQKGSPRSYRRAIEIFTEAVENDPTSALAYAGLAIGYSQLGHSPFPTSGAYLRAKEAAEKAIQYDPTLAEAHLAVAMYRVYYEWDFVAAEEAFLRALALNPSLVDAHYHYAWLLELLHRDDEAIRYGEHSKALNPLSPFYSSWLADQYRDAGMFEKALDEAQTTLELNPSYPVAWLALGQTYLDMGRIEEAIAAHENLRGNAFWGYALAATLAASGDEDKAEEVRRFIREKQNNPFTLALINGGLGDREETLRWLTRAKEEKIPWFPWQVTWFPQTRFLHADPEMQQFAQELGLEFPK